ncbi:MAG: CDP-diacylglycerol--glycerol-3-phosphate 3-phosphatidyltransferase [Acidobacteriota bacterium]
MLNLPNLLTCFRILLVPILVVVLLTKFEGKDLVGLGVFLLAAVTDFLDGWIARRWGLITRLGKLLDPAADKILTSAAFISLVEMGRISSWIVVVIIAREFAVSTLRSVAATESVVIAAAWSGKVKTVTQMVAISLLIIQPQLGEWAVLGTWAVWAALAMAIYSGIDYGVAYARRLRAMRAATPPTS